jgi:hypothetical protein
MILLPPNQSDFAMLALEENLDAIYAACQANDVKRLELFGSWARDTASQESDVDFLVEFQHPLRPGLFDRYYALHSALASIFQRPVDLIEHSSVQNLVFSRQIAADRKVVYAA